MRPAGSGIILIVLMTVSLGACAPEIVRQPAVLSATTEASGGTIEVLEEVSVPVGPGYRRTIWPNGVWTRIGRVSQGEVYKPVTQVFTVEGAHIHEAYLVLDGDRLVGFYLPVERAFSPAPDGPSTTLSIRRRTP